MKWMKYSVRTTEEAEDLVSGALYDLGIDSVEITDKRPPSAEEQAGLFGDVVPDMPADDHLADIAFYVDADQDQEEILLRVRSALEDLKKYSDIGSCDISTSETRDEDWVNNWKKYFHQFRVEDILIVPTWEKVPDSAGASLVLRIDPGTAFGTGKHDTTQLAIRALKKNIRKGDRLLDIGTGSGILGIVALKYGADFVFGTDIDINVLPAVHDNLVKNQLPEERFQTVIGNIIDDPKTQSEAGDGYDIVTANIIAEILVKITPEVPKHLKKGGIFILSGILSDREKMVTDALAKAGMEVLSVGHMGDWSGMTARLL